MLNFRSASPTRFRQVERAGHIFVMPVSEDGLIKAAVESYVKAYCDDLGIQAARHKAMYDEAMSRLDAFAKAKVRTCVGERLMLVTHFASGTPFWEQPTSRSKETPKF